MANAIRTLKRLALAARRRLLGDRRPRVLSRRQRRAWERDGYLVIPGFFPRAEVDHANGAIDDLWRNRAANDFGLSVDVFIGAPEERRVRWRDVPESARNLPYKLNDLYLISPEVRELVLSQRIVAILDELLEGKPIACNSLNFERGSQQGFHTDNLYMPPLVPDKMAATWIALEDSTQLAGPLRYYPGSHRIPPYRFSDGRLAVTPAEMPDFEQYMDRQIAARGLREATFVAKAGDLFIWHAGLYHGGAPIRDLGQTRRSLVTHYFRAQDMDAAAVQDIGGERYLLRRDPHQVPR